MAASRVASWVPSWPRDLNPYCLRHKPPASVNSNSANLRLVAPKSTTKNDFLFSISTVHALLHKFPHAKIEKASHSTGASRKARGDYKEHFPGSNRKAPDQP